MNRVTAVQPPLQPWSEFKEPPAPPPEYIRGGLCGLIKIKEITCKDQRKRASPSSKRLDSQGIIL